MSPSSSSTWSDNPWDVSLFIFYPDWWSIQEMSPSSWSTRSDAPLDVSVFPFYLERWSKRCLLPPILPGVTIHEMSPSSSSTWSDYPWDVSLLLFYLEWWSKRCLPPSVLTGVTINEMSPEISLEPSKRCLHPPQFYLEFMGHKMSHSSSTTWGDGPWDAPLLQGVEGALLAEGGHHRPTRIAAVSRTTTTSSTIEFYTTEVKGAI